MLLLVNEEMINFRSHPDYLAVACSGLVSICRTGSMISSDWVRVDPVEYKIRAAFTLVDER